MGKGRRPPKPLREGFWRPPAWVAAVVLALFATILSAWLCQRVFEGIPHVTDGVAYAFQARVFASGRLWLAPPPVPEAFEIGNVVLSEDRWVAKYPPGFPALLSLGYLLHLPGLVNPVLLGLAVFGVFRLGRTLYDAPTGLLGALLLAISPFALIYGATFLSHVPTLCVTVWAFDAIARGRKSDGVRPLLLAGFLAGLAAAIRPYTAAALLLPAGVWLLWRAAPRVALRRAALVLGGAVLPLLLHAGFNAVVWGNPLQTGYTFGESTERLTGTSGHYSSPLALLRDHLPRYLVDLNRDPWAEPWPDLLPLLFLLPRRSRRAGDGLLLACTLATVLAHSVYWSYDMLHSGPRYATEALGPLALLVARGLTAVVALLHGRLEGLRVPHALQITLFFSIAGVLLWFPLGRRLPELMEINSKAYCGQTHQPLHRDGGEKVGENALILVSGNLPMISYSGLALLNEPDPQAGGRVFALDYRLRREELMEAYPRQQVWQLAIFLESVRPENALLIPAYGIRRVLWTRVR
ncbi:MAG: glycosyltransferase family 39 protein [Thermoanaerobaculia bacterium]